MNQPAASVARCLSPFSSCDGQNQDGRQSSVDKTGCSADQVSAGAEFPEVTEKCTLKEPLRVATGRERRARLRPRGGPARRVCPESAADSEQPPGTVCSAGSGMVPAGTATVDWQCLPKPPGQRKSKPLGFFLLLLFLDLGPQQAKLRGDARFNAQGLQDHIWCRESNGGGCIQGKHLNPCSISWPSKPCAFYFFFFFFVLKILHIHLCLRIT